MRKLNSDFERAPASFKLAISFQPFNSPIVDSLSYIVAHVETTMIRFSKGQTDFSLVLIHLRYSQIWIFLFEFIRIDKHLLMPHKVVTRKGFLLE